PAMPTGLVLSACAARHSSIAQRGNCRKLLLRSCDRRSRCFDVAQIWRCSARYKGSPCPKQYDGEGHAEDRRNRRADCAHIDGGRKCWGRRWQQEPRGAGIEACRDRYKRRLPLPARLLSLSSSHLCEAVLRLRCALLPPGLQPVLLLRGLFR